MSRSSAGPARAPGAAYLVAGALMLVDYLLVSRGLSHVRAGFDYRQWSLQHGLYSDVLELNLEHYLRVGHVIHPLPYVHDRIEYPVLLGFVLWLPAWLPGGPSTWLAVEGLLAAAATFGCIHLVGRRRPASAWWIAASPALLLDSAVNWDLIGIFFLVAAVVWFAEERLVASGAAAGVGVCFKLFPVAVAPMAVTALGSRWWHAATGRGAAVKPEVGPDVGPDVEPEGEPPGERATQDSPSVGSDRRRPPPGALADVARWAVPFALICGAVFVPLLVVSPSNTWWFARFNDTRPVKDALWGLLGLGFPQEVVRNGFVNPVSLLIVAATMAFGAWRIWPLPPDRHGRAVALATAMVIIVWMAVNKIWNPQYVLWVFAVGALTSMPAAFGVILGAFSIYDWWFEFHLRLPSRPLAFASVGQSSVAIRVVLFGLMAGWAGRELWRLAHQPAEVRPERTPAASVR